MENECTSSFKTLGKISKEQVGGCPKLKGEFAGKRGRTGQSNPCCSKQLLNKICGRTSFLGTAGGGRGRTES